MESKKHCKQLRKKKCAAFKESEEEARRENMDTFKTCGGNLRNYIETFTETQKQQMAMMGQFIWAMTQSMTKNAGLSSSK